MPWQPELQGEEGELVEEEATPEVIEGDSEVPSKAASECGATTSRLGDSAPRALFQQVGRLRPPLADSEPFRKRTAIGSSARNTTSSTRLMASQPISAAPLSSEEEVADAVSVDDDDNGVDLDELEDRIWRDQLRLRRLKEKRTGAGHAHQPGVLTQSGHAGARSHRTASGDRDGRTTSSGRPQAEGVSPAQLSCTVTVTGMAFTLNFTVTHGMEVLVLPTWQCQDRCEAHRLVVLQHCC